MEHNATYGPEYTQSRQSALRRKGAIADIAMTATPVILK
jgi:hypothetical protein